jgi:[ribosomal protein S18]-alanine N-acetyltransferase
VTRVRPAGADDVDAVAALEREVFGADAWSPASVEQELTGPWRRAFVALDDAGAVCGYLVLLTPADPDGVADLQRVAVAVAARRRGVASELWAACDDAACSRVLLEVRGDNAGAVAFYRRLGFRAVGHRRGYYADGAGAVVMERARRRAAGR